LKESKYAENKTNYKVIAAAVIIIVIIAAVAVLFFQDRGDETKVTANIKEIYKILTDRDVEVLSAKYENGIYKLVIRIIDATGNSNVQDLFATKDGQYMTDKLIDMQAYRLGLVKEKDFIDCLFNRGVRIVGISNNTASVLQVQALGSFGYRLYFDCAGENLQICQNIGVKSVPSVIYNNTIYEGLKEPAWFAALTNCTI